jgi:hypothetical protein
MLWAAARAAKAVMMKVFFIMGLWLQIQSRGGES